MGSSFFRRRAEQRLHEARERLQQESPAEGLEAEAKPSRGGIRSGGPGGWRSLVEQRIQEGIEQGLFDNLPGAGKPLNLDEDALVPEDMRMAFRLLRSNGLAPLWVELNKEIRDDIERLKRFRLHVHTHGQNDNPIQQAHYRSEYSARIRDINAKILNYNIIAPSSLVHLQALMMDEEMERFDQRPMTNDQRPAK